MNERIKRLQEQSTLIEYSLYKIDDNQAMLLGRTTKKSNPNVTLNEIHTSTDPLMSVGSAKDNMLTYQHDNHKLIKHYLDSYASHLLYLSELVNKFNMIQMNVSSLYTTYLEMGNFSPSQNYKDNETLCMTQARPAREEKP